MSKIPLKLKVNQVPKHIQIPLTIKPIPAYHGEQTCEKVKKSGQACQNKAYYVDANQKLVCGVHSKEGNRIDLPKNPDQKMLAGQHLANHQAGVEAQAVKNREAGRRGRVICSKMQMMKAVEDHEGYLKIFPNYKHGNRTDGMGLPSLSPMSLGPIQAFPEEVDAKTGQLLPAFYQTQLDMYGDMVPHRHKLTSKKKNIPVYSVWRDKAGKEHHITYIESRQFYCWFYELFVLMSPDYQYLVEKLDDGYNLQICGYDAYDVTQTVEQHYLDSSRPFGHELVLFTLLTCESKDYPWRKHKTFDF